MNNAIKDLIAKNANDRLASLEESSSKDLVELYNSTVEELNDAAAEHGLGFVKRFSDRKVGLRRTNQALQILADTVPASAPEPKEPKAKRQPRFVFPPTDSVKNVREGTNRAKLVEMLSTDPGATFEECIAATWGAKEGMSSEKAKKTTYEGIRLLHYYVGYGMKQDEQGRITIYTK